ncbi:MAG: GNAT family N-acetyltransferase [Gammaproteobacteria bacterium]|nr:GNAT family N-acetyltransferase [Gammaproteobacteria bacterium]
MDVDYQELSSDNAGLLEKLGQEVFDNAIEPAQLQAFLDDPRHVMVIAVADSTVVGMGSGVEYYHPDKPPQLWINEVGVATAHRKQGIGRRLVAELITIAEERGCVYAWLGTDSHNAAGQACFNAVPGGEDPQPFVLYEWSLTD